MKPPAKPSVCMAVPISCRNKAATSGERTITGMFSPQSNSSSKQYFSYATQQFYSVLNEEQQVARDKYFLGCQLHRKPLPYSSKINFINKSQPKARPKNNISDYFMNTIRHNFNTKFNTTNRFKASDRTKSLKEVAKKDKRLMQICADI